MVDVVADRVIVELFAKLDQYDRGVANSEAKSNRAFDNIATGGTRMETSLKSSFLGSASAATLLVRSLGYITAALGVREVQRYSDSWVSAGNKISALGTPLGEQQDRLHELADVAVDTRAAFDGTVQTFARLELSTRKLNKSQAELLRLTETINKAFAVGGAAGSERSAASLQLSQALSSGTLGGDELRSVRENAPIIARAIADVMGTTVGNLKNLGEQGQLTSEVIIEALDRLGPEVDRAFLKTTPTITEALENLHTRLVEFTGTAGQTSGAAHLVAGSINLLAENFDKLADAALIVGAVFAGRSLQGVAASASAYANLRSAVNEGRAVLIQSVQAEEMRARAAAATASSVLAEAQAERQAGVARAAALRETIAIHESYIAQTEAQAAAAVAESNRAVLAIGLQNQKELERQASLKATLTSRQALRVATTELNRQEVQNLGLAISEAAAAANAAKANEVLAATVVATTFRMRAAAAATKLWQTALMFFGGPVGLAITGLSIAMLVLANRTDDVADATERAKGAEDGFWKVVDRTTLKIKEQNSALAENARLNLKKSLRETGGALQSGVEEFRVANTPATGIARAALASNPAASARASFLRDFAAAGDTSAEAFTSLENKLLDLQNKFPDMGDAALQQVGKLRKLAEQQDRNAAELAVLNGTASPKQIELLKGQTAATEDLTSATSASSDAYAKALKSVQDRTASLKLDAELAGKSTLEAEKARAAAELRTAADEDLAKAEDKRAKITSKAASVTKSADAELAAAKKLHDDRVAQIDAVSDALARQAVSAERAKKSVALTEDQKKFNEHLKEEKQSLDDQAHAMELAANGTKKAAIEAQVYLYTQNLLRDAIKSTGKVTDDQRKSIAALGDEMRRSLTAGAARDDAKQWNDDAERRVKSVVQETDSLRDEIAALGLTHDAADRLHVKTMLLSIATEAEAKGETELAKSARDAAAAYDLMSRKHDEASKANANAVAVGDKVREGIVDIGIAALTSADNFGAAVASMLRDLGLLILKMQLLKLVEDEFGPTGTPIKFGSSGGGGILSGVFDFFAGMFATGGTVPKGQWGIVGERGAEPVRWTPGGIQVQPNSSLREIPAIPEIASPSQFSGGQVSSLHAPVTVHVSLAGANGDDTIIRYARAAAQQGAEAAVKRVTRDFPKMLRVAQRDFG